MKLYLVTTSKYQKHTQQNREDKRERVRAVKHESQEKKEERERERGKGGRNHSLTRQTISTDNIDPVHTSTVSHDKQP